MSTLGLVNVNPGGIAQVPPPPLPNQQSVVASTGPLGTQAEAWSVSWSSGNGPTTPFICVITSALPAGPAPIAAIALVTAYWSDGPPQTPLADFGVQGFTPPQGAGTTVTAAIDAAVVAAAALYGSSILDDADVSLRSAIQAAWLVWLLNGGAAVPGGAGGQLQTLALGLG